MKKAFKKLKITTSPELDGKIHEEISRFKGQTNKNMPAQPVLGRIIMKSNIAKIAVAAVIILAVLLAIHYSGGSIDGSSVVWADVLKKIEASRGVIFRRTEIPNAPGDYSISYRTPEYSRKDSYQGDKIISTIYENFNSMTITSVWHETKSYVTTPLTTNEAFMQSPDHYVDPMYMIERILSCKHQKLEPQIIEGVLCEGIETTDPNLLLATGITEEMMQEEGAADFVKSLELEIRLWADVKTQYPAMVEWKTKMEIAGQKMEHGHIIDQYQWDVDIDSGIFEPDIPADYRNIKPQGMR